MHLGVSHLGLSQDLSDALVENTGSYTLLAEVMHNEAAQFFLDFAKILYLFLLRSVKTA
jgi:hypothetical protein